MVVSRELIAHFLSPELQERLQLEQSVEYTSSWPLRVSDPSSQAGFYDQFHGYLPWSLSAEPVETIDISRYLTMAELIPSWGSSPSTP